MPWDCIMDPDLRYGPRPDLVVIVRQHPDLNRDAGPDLGSTCAYFVRHDGGNESRGQRRLK